jgi:hypothetical protein
MMEMVFSVGPAPRLYNEDPRPAGRIIETVFEMTVEDDSEEIARTELGRAKKTSCVLQLQ